jgi:hypothetical protein
LAITLLFAHVLILSPDPPPISVEPINTFNAAGKHFDSDFVTGVCSLHELPFKRGRAETASGLSEYNEEYKQAREEQFPNSNGYGDKPTERNKGANSLSQYCEKCREAEARWIEAHKPNR